MNVLQIIQSVCYEANIPAPSSGLASSTDPSVLQLVNLFYSVGRELVQEKCWIQLKRTHSITWTTGTTVSLPSDFFCSLLDTFWDTTSRLKLGGPLSDAQFNELLYGYAFVATRKYYRVFGRPGTNQLEFNPEPKTGDEMSFDYISKNWLATAAFAAFQETITADTNVCVFDDDLMIMGLKYKLYREKRWEWESYYQDFRREIAKAQARYQGSQKVSLFRTWPYLFFPNIPEGSYGP